MAQTLWMEQVMPDSCFLHRTSAELASTLRIGDCTGLAMQMQLHRCRQHLVRSLASSTETSLEGIVKRLDALEARLNDTLQQGHPPSPAATDVQPEEQQDWGKGWGKPKAPVDENSSATEKAADKAADVMEDAAADAVQKLHPALIKFLNSGYLVSQQQLRQRLMQMEWEGTLRLWAQRKGLAEFEQWLAEKGEEQGIQVDWKDLQHLYRNPEDLSPLDANPRARMLAHAMIQHAMLDKQLETFRACTDTAKQLANVMESGQRTGASTLLGALRKLLPIPFLR